MDAEVVKQFNAELSTIFDSKNLSKNKIQDITRAALKAKAHYKHVVHGVERLIAKCKPEQRVNALYVIDSIVRASKHQLKEKDVFGPRVLKQFDKFLEPLLKCGQKERMKTIRTLNLWMSNKVFTEAEIQPWREKCKKAGLIIDFEAVEMAVKGKQADMSIYKGVYKKKEKPAHQHKSRTPPNPPPDDGLLGAGPSAQIPSFVLSEERYLGTISERELMEFVHKFGLDRGGLLSKDKGLLQKALQVFVESLTQKIAEVQSENRKKNGTNIQNVLTKDFEYSDDEEDKEKDPELEEEKVLSHEDILGLAQNLFTQPKVLTQFNEVLNTAVNPFGLPLTAESIVPTSVGQFPIGAPRNLLPLPQNLPPGFPNHQLGLPNISGLNPALLGVPNAQNLIYELQLQQHAAQLQALQNNPAAQRNFLMMGNPLLNALNAIPAGLNHLLPADIQALAAQQQQQQQPPPLLNDEGSVEKKLLAVGGLEESSRSRPKEKESRERRKMGLPPVKPGFTIIASRTLVLKKIPTNVTENEIKQSVEACGEVSRVKVIGNRACAFVTMETRRAANEVVQKLQEVSVAKKMVKVYWASSAGMNGDQFSNFWNADNGVWEIPYDQLPTDLASYCEGAVLDLESLPDAKKPLYKDTGESIVVAPVTSVQPPAPQPPPLSFPFPGGHLAQLPPPRPQGVPPGVLPGVPPMFNLNAPPPPGLPTMPPLHGYAAAPPPPGVGPPPMQGVPPPGFDPNKPPPMFQHNFNAGAPPPPFGRGAGPMPPFARGGMHPHPPPFRGRGVAPPHAHFDSPRRGAPIPFSPHGGPRDRGRLPDQSEIWSREREQRGRDYDRGHGRDRERDRERSFNDRYRNDSNDNGSRRRTSRWGEDDRREESAEHSRFRRRSPERRPRHSPSYEREEPEVKRPSVEEETVSSTTLDEMKPTTEPSEPVVEDPPAKQPDSALQEDKTDEVPMDLE